MNYRISRPAHSILDEIWNFVATSAGSIEIADRVDEEIHESIKLLARFPGMGHTRSGVTSSQPRS